MTATATARLRDNPALLIGLLLLIDGLHFVFARSLRGLLPPLVAALYVLGIGTVQVAGYAAATGHLRWGTFRRHALFFLVVGALVAASTGINYTAVAFIDPGTASMLAQTSLLFSLGFGVAWLGERLTRMQWLGALISIAGVVVITFEPGDYFRAGSLLVIGSAFLYAIHTATVKRYGGGIPFIEFFAWRLIATSSFLLVFALSQGGLAWPSGPAWLRLLLAGTVDVVISRTLYYAALRRVDVSLLTLVLTVSPVVAIAWSLLLYGVLPTPKELIGGAAVLAGLALVTSQRRAAG
jgi:O-acetylserine/cysteine efflux transporter